jgi:tRNA dimethylallyltransferase
VPVLVGGSGLYISAVVDALNFPGTDTNVRARLEAELDTAGPVAMHARLVRTDPLAAERILPTNGRRIVRALEVIEITGSAYAASLPRPDHSGGWIRIGLTGDRAAIDARVKTRVDRMWHDGFVDEVRALERGGLRLGRTASRALGYRQVLEFLAGACTEEQARAATVQATRRFVRRQETWFRRDSAIAWIPHDLPAADALATVRRLIAASRSAPARAARSAEP